MPQQGSSPQMAWDASFAGIKPQGCREEKPGCQLPWSLGQAGRREEALLPGHSLTRTTPWPLSEHWGIISPFNHKKQICACHRRAVRMETAAQTSMGHTQTQRRKKKSCKNPNPAISSLFISSLYRAPQGKCYQTVSEHLIQQRPSFGKRKKEKQNKR